jgi:hypothetical protein
MFSRKYHCTSCDAEGDIQKTYRDGSLFYFFLFLSMGILPGFIYMAFVMKEWKGCSFCRGKTLVELDDWKKAHPNKLTNKDNSTSTNNNSKKNSFEDKIIGAISCFGLIFGIISGISMGSFWKGFAIFIIFGPILFSIALFLLKLILWGKIEATFGQLSVSIIVLLIAVGIIVAATLSNNTKTNPVSKEMIISNENIIALSAKEPVKEPLLKSGLDGDKTAKKKVQKETSNTVKVSKKQKPVAAENNGESFIIKQKKHDELISKVCEELRKREEIRKQLASREREGIALERQETMAIVQQMNYLGDLEKELENSLGIEFDRDNQLKLCGFAEYPGWY